MQNQSFVLANIRKKKYSVLSLYPFKICITLKKQQISCMVDWMINIFY